MTRAKKKPFVYLTLAIAILPVFITAIWQVQVVEVNLPKKGNEPIAMVRIKTGDMITMRYRHSNELIQVEGRFSVDEDSILHAVETRFESSGSGLPVSYPERTSKKGNWLVVDEQNQEIGTLRFYIVPINQTRLEIGSQPVLISNLESGALIEVRAQRVSNIKWFLMNWNF